MENSVLGNALEGVPEDDDEDEGKDRPKDSNVEGTENVDGEETVCFKLCIFIFSDALVLHLSALFSNVFR